MDGSVSQPPAKASRSKKKKLKSSAKIDHHSDSDSSNERVLVVGRGEQKSGIDDSATKSPAKRGPKTVDVRLPGPSPTRARARGGSEESEAPRSTRSGAKRSTHHHSKSSISSLDRVVQQAAAASSSKKSSPATNFKTPKPSSAIRSGTPDSDTEDNISIADSTVSVNRVRRTEEERIQYFKNQPECGKSEPHQALCTRCNKFVKLGRAQTYTVRPWETHRARCDQMPRPEATAPSPVDGGIDSGGGDSVSSRSPGATAHLTESQRKAIFESDERVAAVTPNKVQCRKCSKWIKLSATSAYCLASWRRHQPRCFGEIQSSRVSTAERKLQIVNDAQAASFGLRHVECGICGVVISLVGEGDYNLASWEGHKSQCAP
ncbi:hypothetical protein BD779DRAFT_100651 [Infundibulicybe gibba]|nr:hypothetical protein BD779DRAFT_100651 [Infundibulicybe gibba]